jgi:hypothetical protein
MRPDLLAFAFLLGLLSGIALSMLAMWAAGALVGGTVVDEVKP